MALGRGLFLGVVRFCDLGPKLGSDRPKWPSKGDLGSEILFLAPGGSGSTVRQATAFRPVLASALPKKGFTRRGGLFIRVLHVLHATSIYTCITRTPFYT
jgi:hypothetical protein